MRIQELLFSSGIVGCGGAGFPTYAKYSGGEIETIIVNGAECEPLLYTDRYLMEHRAGDIIRALVYLLQESGAGDGVIGLKKSYTAQIRALQEAIRDSGAPVRLHLMDSFYPAGDEQTLVYEVTGKVVPPGGIPLNVGCVVNNVATLCCIADALEGKPFTHKYLTVTGAVRKPSILRVPLGTPVEQCLSLAGGTTIDHYVVVNGGPMMGKLLEQEDLSGAFVTKTMSGLIVLPSDGSYAAAHRVSVPKMLNRARSACIQCSYCTQFCPRALLGHPLKPHMIMRKLSAGSLSELLGDKEIRNAALCCECGICEVVACPMGLQPRRINALVKSELQKAGIRYQRENRQAEVLPQRDMRKAPTGRTAAKAGVGEYTNIRSFSFQEPEEGEISRVRLSLRQGIGAPVVPEIRNGSRVMAGQRIASVESGKLGTTLHAPICGIAAVGEGYIEIVNEKGAWD